MPSAGSKSAKSGKVGRSISPGVIPYVARMLCTCAANISWV